MIETPQKKSIRLIRPGLKGTNTSLLYVYFTGPVTDRVPFRVIYNRTIDKNEKGYVSVFNHGCQKYRLF